jgi:hypothetical protein
MMGATEAEVEIKQPELLEEAATSPLGEAGSVAALQPLAAEVMKEGSLRAILPVV